MPRTDRFVLSSPTSRLAVPTCAVRLVISLGLLASACSGGDDSALDDLAPSPDVTAEQSASSSSADAPISAEENEQSDGSSTDAERSETTTSTVPSTTSSDSAGDQLSDGSTTTDTTVDADDSDTDDSDSEKSSSDTDDSDTDDSETDESNSSDRITDADAAGRWVDDSSGAFAAYFVEAVTGDGADFSLLEAAATYYDGDSLEVDLPAFNRCNVDDILPLRSFLGEDGIYTVEGRVLEVREVDDDLWIVDYRVTQFVTGIGDTVTDQIVYVGRNGTIGTRPSADGDELSCEQKALSHTDTGQIRFDKAVASDE